jgi:sugar phosphate isomerase/epimerase
MQRLSISELTTCRWSLEQDAEEFARRGFGGIGLWHWKLADYELDVVTDLIFQHRLAVSSYSWAGGFTGTDGRSLDDALDDAQAAIRQAARLGSPIVIVHPGARGNHTGSHARRLFKMALERLAPYAVDYGVRLAIEPMEGSRCREWTIFETIHETMRWIEQYPPKVVGMVVDSFYWHPIERWLAGLAELLPRIALVQLADVAPPGRPLLDGLTDLVTVDWSDWIARFDGLGYEGLFEVEIHGPRLRRGSAAGQGGYDALLDELAARWREARRTVCHHQPADRRIAS